MKVGFYPGCSLQGSSKEYSQSLLAVADKCGVTLEEINDWNCCGASAAHNVSHDLALTLPARTIALAERQGLKEVVVPCAACYSRLASTQQEILKDEDTHQRIEGYLEMSFPGQIRLLTVLEFLQQYIFPVADQYIVNPVSYTHLTLPTN
jgi:heterodisulfide reductase subunit B